MSDAAHTLLTLGEVLGITIGGGFGGLCIVVIILVLVARRRTELDEIKRMEEAPTVGNEPRVVLRTTYDTYRQVKRSRGHFPIVKNSSDARQAFDITRDYLTHSEPEFSLAQQSPVRISGLRDSWPLVSAIEMPAFSLDLIPTDSAISISQISPLGGVLTAEREAIPMTRSSTSGGNMSNLLRSTSEHLKSARTHSLRVLRVFGSPGPPPKKELPPVPVRRHTDRLEVPISRNHHLTNVSPAEKNPAARKARSAKIASGNPACKSANRGDAFTSSLASNVDLCVVDRLGARARNMPIPNRQCSPIDQWKQTNGEKSSTSHISTFIGHKKHPPLLNTDPQNSLRNAVPKKTSRTSSARDPFLLSAKGSISSTPNTSRPQYTNKPLSRHESFPQRPAATVSSPRTSLGALFNNALVPQKRRAVGLRKKSTTFEQPFLPYKESQDVPRREKTQLTTSRSELRRNGHQGSQVVGLSGPLHARLPALPKVPEDYSSSKSPVPQEAEGDVVEPLKSPSPTMTSLLDSFIDIPPTPTEFANQTLAASERTAHVDQDSPTLGLFESSMPSATMSVFHYYTGNKSLDDLQLSKRRKHSSIQKQRRHKKSQSDGRILRCTSVAKSVTPLPSPPLQRSDLSSRPPSSEISLGPNILTEPRSLSNILESDQNGCLSEHVVGPDLSTASPLPLRTSARLEIPEFQRLYQKRLERRRFEQEHRAFESVENESEAHQHLDQVEMTKPLGIRGIEIPPLSTVENLALMQPKDSAGRKETEDQVAKHHPKNQITVPSTPLFNTFKWPDSMPRSNASRVRDNSQLEYYSQPMLRKGGSQLPLRKSSLKRRNGRSDYIGRGQYDSFEFPQRSANCEGALETERRKRRLLE